MSSNALIAKGTYALMSVPVNVATTNVPRALLSFYSALTQLIDVINATKALCLHSSGAWMKFVIVTPFHAGRPQHVGLY